MSSDYKRSFEKNITPTKWFMCKQKTKAAIRHIKENPADLLLVALGAVMMEAFESIDEVTEV